jgi:hypothetical protein
VVSSWKYAKGTHTLSHAALVTWNNQNGKSWRNIFVIYTTQRSSTHRESQKRSKFVKPLNQEIDTMAKKRPLPTYKAYVFKGAAPIMQAFHDARADSGLSAQDIRDSGGPAVATQRAWDKGKTKRPQFTTIAAGTKAMGKNIIDLSGAIPVFRHSARR